MKDEVLEKIKVALSDALPEGKNVAGIFAAYLPLDSNIIGMAFNPPLAIHSECSEGHVHEHAGGARARIRFLEMIRDCIDQKIEMLRAEQ